MAIKPRKFGVAAAADIIGDTIEGTIAGAGAALGGALAGAGSAVGGIAQGIGSAIGGALQGALTEGPKTIINNVGVAGSAGAQKVKTGGGTLPPPKKTAKPAYNEKMPTEKLLAVAVEYLHSIDSSLRTQIENDRLTRQKQVQAEKEATVEDKGPSVFARLGDKFRNKTEAVKSNKWNIAKTLLTGAAIVGGIGAIGISKLDTSELDELKANLSAFKRNYGWLLDIAAVASGAAAGFKIGSVFGPWGRIIGAIGGGLITLGYQMDNKRDIFAEQRSGLFSENAKAKAEEYFKTRSMLMNQRGGDPTKKGFLESFRAYMQGTAGNEETVSFLKNDLKQQGYSDSEIDTILFGTQDEAVPVSGNTMTGSMASASSTTSQEAYVPSGDQKVDFAMQYLMKNLGLKQFQAAGIVANLMAESGLDTNAFNDAGGGRGAYGIAQWRGARQDGLDAFAASRGKRRDDFETQLAWLVQEMKTTHKDTLPSLQATTSSADATTVFLDKFERPSAADRESSLKKRISYGMAAERGTSLQTAQSTYEEPAALAAQARGASTGGSVVDMLSMAKKIFGKAGAAIIGADRYDTRPITTPGVESSTKISDLSRKIEADTISGRVETTAKTGPVAALASQQSIIQASNDGTLGSIDPNYPSSNDLIRTYLSHWKVAA